MAIKDYFDKNQGLLAAMALFAILMFTTLQTDYLYFSFVSYYLTLLLLSYLVWDLEIPDSLWEGVLQVGFLMFVIALFDMASNYTPLLGDAPKFLYYIPVLFYIVAILKIIWKNVNK